MIDHSPLLKLDRVGLVSRLGHQAILQDISFTAEPGDRLAVVGPSGAGKTSLLRLINRLSEPTQGTIYLEGQQIRQIPVLQLRQQVVLVLQESKLLGMRVREALQYPLKLRKLNPTAIQQQVATWMDILHLPQDWLDRTELELSVGQRQWVAIARGLIAQPKVLLLDEPTSALDAGRTAHLLQVLQQAAVERSITILMVNHQLDVAQEFSDRFLYVEKGQLTQQATSASVDWGALKASLIQTELQEQEDWGSD